VRFVARIPQDNSGTLGRVHCGLEQIPEGPVAAVKSRDQELPERRRRFPGIRQRPAIGFRKNLEAGSFQVRVKSIHDPTKSGQVDLFELSPSGAELLKQSKEMIRSAPDGNRGQALGIRKCFVGQQLFRGESEQQAQVLTRGERQVTLPGEESTEIWWRDELQAQRGKPRSCFQASATACLNQPSAAPRQAASADEASSNVCRRFG